MIPASLLNATVEILAEVSTADSMGAPVRVLKPVCTVSGRADQKSIQATGDEYVKSATRYKVFINGDWGLNYTNWVRVTGHGSTFLGQVATVSRPGWMGHHTEIEAYSQFNPPPITGVLGS